MVAEAEAGPDEVGLLGHDAVADALLVVALVDELAAVAVAEAAAEATAVAVAAAEAAAEATAVAVAVAEAAAEATAAPVAVGEAATEATAVADLDALGTGLDGRLDADGVDVNTEVDVALLEPGRVDKLLTLAVLVPLTLPVRLVVEVAVAVAVLDEDATPNGLNLTALTMPGCVPVPK
jgi:hypothetical protein